MQQQTMTSLVIAEVMGKPHKDVLKAIRAMEPAWIKVGRRKFSPSSYINSQNKEYPMYELTKAECLYIATKFNDEARARLVLRWEELEIEARQRWMDEQKFPKAVDGVLGDVSPRTVLKALELCVQNQTAIQDLYHKFDYCQDVVEDCSRRIEKVGGGKEAPYLEKIRDCVGIEPTATPPLGTSAPEEVQSQPVAPPKLQPKPKDMVEGIVCPASIRDVAKHINIPHVLLCQWLVLSGSAYNTGTTFYLKESYVRKQYLIRKGDRFPYVREKDLSLYRYLWTKKGVKYLLKIAERYQRIPMFVYRNQDISPSANTNK